MECDKIVAIKPGAQKWGSRECAWFPIPHFAPSKHIGCGGAVHEINGELTCEVCEHVVDVADVKVSEACDGHKREIK
jgi:hypothetical protein